LGYLGGELVQGAGGGAGEGRESRRQRCFQFGFDVDVFKELFRQVVGEAGLDRFVLEQLVAGVDPVVGVEGLPVDPDREDRDEGDQGGEDEQGRDDARVP
jgi:hypothetical protein